MRDFEDDPSQPDVQVPPLDTDNCNYNLHKVAPNVVSQTICIPESRESPNYSSEFEDDTDSQINNAPCGKILSMQIEVSSSSKFDAASSVDNSYEVDLCTSAETTSVTDGQHGSQDIISQFQVKAELVQPHLAKFHNLGNPAPLSRGQSDQKNTLNLKVINYEKLIAVNNTSFTPEMALEQFESPIPKRNQEAVIDELANSVVSKALERARSQLTDRLADPSLVFAKEISVSLTSADDVASSGYQLKNALVIEDDYRSNDDEEVDTTSILHKKSCSASNVPQEGPVDNGVQADNQSELPPNSNIVADFEVHVELGESESQLEMERLDALQIPEKIGGKCSSPISISISTAYEASQKAQSVDANNVNFREKFDDYSRNLEMSVTQQLHKGDIKLTAPLDNKRLRPIERQNAKSPVSIGENVKTSAVNHNLKPKVQQQMSSVSKSSSGKRTPVDFQRRRQQQDDLDRERQLQEKRRQMNERVMQEWLLQKQQERIQLRLRQKAMEKYKKEMDEVKKREEDRRRKESFQAWIQQKEMQKNWNRLLKEHEEEEQRQFQEMRSRDASEQAFREWLRRKNREAQQRAREGRERGRIGQAILLQRQRSVAIVRAMQRANAENFSRHHTPYC